MALADLSPIVSVIALAVSLFTLWFTVLRRGTIRCTHPSFIAFRYDFVGTKVPLGEFMLVFDGLAAVVLDQDRYDVFHAMHVDVGNPFVKDVHDSSPVVILQGVGDGRQPGQSFVERLFELGHTAQAEEELVRKCADNFLQ